MKNITRGTRLTSWQKWMLEKFCHIENSILKLMERWRSLGEIRKLLLRTVI